MSTSLLDLPILGTPLDKVLKVPSTYQTYDRFVKGLDSAVVQGFLSLNYSKKSCCMIAFDF